jgi:hypothetical protein
VKYTDITDLLTQHKIISDEQSNAIHAAEETQPFSIHWELKAVLYLGITLLSSGLGVVIYENIDSIGHTVLITLLSLVCLACFFFAFKYRKPFTWGENLKTTNLDDFALLSGCLAFLILESYLQYQYDLFGTRYGLAALIPAVLFFGLAYIFDHRGVLSMAITALASSIGISIIPVKMWETFDFESRRLIVNALILGISLTLTGWFSEYKNKKKHFLFTYLVFGGNMAFVAALAGLFTLNFKLIYFLITAILALVFVVYARKKQSYMCLLMAVIYGYIAATYLIFKYVFKEVNGNFESIYFMLSAGLIIILLLRIKAIVGQEV